MAGGRGGGVTGGSSKLGRAALHDLVAHGDPSTGAGERPELAVPAAVVLSVDQAPRELGYEPPFNWRPR